MAFEGLLAVYHVEQLSEQRVGAGRSRAGERGTHTSAVRVWFPTTSLRWAFARPRLKTTNSAILVARVLAAFRHT